MARIYHDLCDLWPIVSPPADYQPEATRLDELIRAHLKHEAPTRPRLLELGAGAGCLLHHLTVAYDIEAIDLSPAMLERCAAQNPGVVCHEGDLRTIRLDRTFDVVAATDSLDYMLTEADLAAGLQTAAAHLRQDGVFVAAVNYLSETFIEHDVAHDRHTRGHLQVTNVSYVHHHPSGTGAELVMLLVIEEDGRVRIEEDRHHCGLFSLSTWRRLLNESGFTIADVEVDADSGAWFVAHRR